MGGTLSVEETAYSRFAKDIKKQNVDSSESMRNFVSNCTNMMVATLQLTYP